MAKGIPIRAPSCFLIVVFLGIWLGPLPCEGQGAVLTDDFDDGTQGWTYLDDPGAVMTWDPDEGNPDPGSLVLSASRPATNVEAFFALGPCMETNPHERWSTESMVKKTGSLFGTCDAYVSVFQSPDCTGEGTVPGTSAMTPPMTPDVWHFRPRSAPVLPRTHSARPVLLMSVPPHLVITCHFDSIVVFRNGVTSPAGVPTLSTFGLLLMVLVLGASAVVLLVRRAVAA